MKTAVEQRPTHDEIARVAYQEWEQKGRPQGQDLECWLKAEEQLTAACKPRSSVRPSYQTRGERT
ncbi:MAG TPA: DUF2934 domain-containing protein [Candidatus Saccharimonadales bacterium]|nr:DUF2934 domain-containing protein [Candidatus Saccharimonadales bacterium]